MSTTDESKPPSLSALARSNNMITIDVGMEHAKYNVYAELITYYSGYFKGTLNGQWKEAEDRAIELPDIEPRVFDIFIDWLYTQNLPRKSEDWITPTPENKVGSHGHGQLAERLMMKSYVFADRFLVPQYRVALYKYYANFCNVGGNPPYYDAIIYAFDNLPANSAILTLLVRTHCAYWNEGSDTADNGELELRQDLPQDFFFRVMAVAAKMRDKEKAKGIACCDCHNETTTTTREGCDTCMPVPEVKEEANAAEGDNQANVAQNNGNDQANAATTNDNNQDHQTTAQADQDGGNNEPGASIDPSSLTGGNDPIDQNSDTGDQNVDSDQTNEMDNQVVQDYPGDGNIAGGGQAQIVPVETVQDHAEITNGSGDVPVHEERAGSSDNSNNVTVETSSYSVDTGSNVETSSSSPLPVSENSRQDESASGSMGTTGAEVLQTAV
ncbi:hypothetical protein DPSP01_002702 [Paraphaeosphaeria sporulosa]